MVRATRHFYRPFRLQLWFPMWYSTKSRCYRQPPFNTNTHIQQHLPSNPTAVCKIERQNTSVWGKKKEKQQQPIRNLANHMLEFPSAMQLSKTEELHWPHNTQLSFYFGTSLCRVLRKDQEKQAKKYPKMTNSTPTILTIGEAGALACSPRA